ncbi:MAG: iron ABC transporter permease [Clostridia bacterium]|nr:iron ABC transporter permease [Clostridia bacterium]
MRSNPVSRDLRRMRGEPLLAAMILASAMLLLLFVVWPILKVLSLPSWANWAAYFQNPRFLKATRNSLFMAAISTLSATALGFLYAYAVNRANVPGSRFFKTIAILPIMTPPFITGLAFILLFGRRGFISWTLLHMRPDIYSWKGLWAVQTFAFFPTAFLATSSVLRSISANLELAATNLGASRWRVFKDIVLPLATPGLASAALLVTSQALADFGNPMLIAGDYTVLATEAYLELITNWSPQGAAVLSGVLLAPALMVFFVQRNILERRSFVTVTGKPTNLEKKGHSPMVRWSLFAACLITSLVVVSVYGVLLVCAFTKTWGANFSFTSYHFVTAVLHGVELKNSFMLSAAAAAFTALFAVLLGYMVNVKKPIGAGALDLMAVIPAAVPGTVLGIGYVLSFNTPPLALTNTAAIIVILMVFRYMTVGYRTTVSSIKQLDRSIEEASTNLGADTIKSFRYVMLPLLRSAFTVSFIYTFIKAMNAVSGPIFLISPQWRLASVSIINLADHGYWGEASSLGVAVVGIIALTLLFFRFALGGKVKLFEI